MTEDAWEMFYPRRLSICPETESGIKCCLGWRVDKNSSPSSTDSFIKWRTGGGFRKRREAEDGWGERRRKRERKVSPGAG